MNCLHEKIDRNILCNFIDVLSVESFLIASRLFETFFSWEARRGLCLGLKLLKQPLQMGRNWKWMNVVLHNKLTQSLTHRFAVRQLVTKEVGSRYKVSGVYVSWVCVLVVVKIPIFVSRSNLHSNVAFGLTNEVDGNLCYLWRLSHNLLLEHSPNFALSTISICSH